MVDMPSVGCGPLGWKCVLGQECLAAAFFTRQQDTSRFASTRGKGLENALGLLDRVAVQFLGAWQVKGKNFLEGRIDRERRRILPCRY